MKLLLNGLHYTPTTVPLFWSPLPSLVSNILWKSTVVVHEIFAMDLCQEGLHEDLSPELASKTMKQYIIYGKGIVAYEFTSYPSVVRTCLHRLVGDSSQLGLSRLNWVLTERVRITLCSRRVSQYTIQLEFQLSRLCVFHSCVGQEKHIMNFS